MTGPIVVGEADFDRSVSLSNAKIDVSAVFQHLIEETAANEPTYIGFPAAVDIEYAPAMPMFGRIWNNIGDPYDSAGPVTFPHTKMLERAVINWCADLVALPPDDRWGYVTSGGTEGNLAALHAAYRRHPEAIAYYSSAAHYSIRKIIEITGIPSAVVDVDRGGEMDYQHLSALVEQNRNRPAIVVATAGTTMTEAVDDPGNIAAVLRSRGVRESHVHVDAALAGIPLALDGALRLDDSSGVDSLSISGHKFFGTPIPCGLLLKRETKRRQGRHIAYTATLDTTVSGSRCGQAAVLLWYAIAVHGVDGHRYRASQARNLAAYAVEKLTAVGWPAWRHPHAFTVVLRTPPPAITEKWLLSTEGMRSHVICMPGVTRGQIDAFVADVASVTESSSVVVPRQRNRLSTSE